MSLPRVLSLDARWNIADEDCCQHSRRCGRDDSWAAQEMQ